MSAEKKFDFIRWVNTTLHVLRIQMKSFERKKGNFDVFKQATIDSKEVEKQAVKAVKQYKIDLEIEDAVNHLDQLVNESAELISEYQKEIELQGEKIKKEKTTKTKKDYQLLFTNT